MTQPMPSFSTGSSASDYASRFNEAMAMIRAAQPGKALAIFDAMLPHWPNDVKLLSALGQLNVRLGRASVGRRHLQRALELRPDDIEDLRALSNTWRASGDFAAANRCLDRVLQLRPDDANAFALKAELLVLAGDEAAAMAMIEPRIKSGVVSNSFGWVFCRVAPKLGRVEEALAYLKKVEAGPPLDPGSRSGLFFSIGDLLDRLGRHDEAFGYFSRANDLMQVRYDPAAVAAAVDRVCQVWTREAIAKMPRSEFVGDETMMFIVGMPRSGTTLVEQVLSCLPGVYGAGELGGVPAAGMEIMGMAIVGLPLIVFPERVTQEKVQSGAKKILDHVRSLAPNATRVIDKLPQNFALLGLIQLMFPKARVIHCARSPMDTCLSCYVNQFFGYMPYSYRLQTLGHFYQQYDKLMKHWKQVLDIPIIDMVYEEVVDDFENKARELVAFTGLPWTDACLNFHESQRMALTTSNAQVRKPLYKSSSGRWKKYEKHLGPLREALGPLAPPA